MNHFMLLGPLNIPFIKGRKNKQSTVTKDLKPCASDQNQSGSFMPPDPTQTLSTRCKAANWTGFDGVGIPSISFVGTRGVPVCCSSLAELPAEMPVCLTQLGATFGSPEF